MNDTSTKIQVWFLRHGKTAFNYEGSNYDDFIQMLCNGHKTPLAENPEIDFESLPKQIDFVGYSPIKRAFGTAELLCKKLDVAQMEEMSILHEVEFDTDIIREKEFKSLKQIRPKILERWYYDQNKAETFKDSLARVDELESFLQARQEKTIILITHGWFLRLLDIYFVQGKHTITIDDLLNTRPVSLGHCIKATIERKPRVELEMI